MGIEGLGFWKCRVQGVESREYGVEGSESIKSMDSKATLNRRKGQDTKILGTKPVLENTYLGPTSMWNNGFLGYI